MTNAILRGKPDAGNPHVRFDEGEVASAKPRRGSLLYKIRKTAGKLYGADNSATSHIAAASVGRGVCAAFLCAVSALWSPSAFAEKYYAEMSESSSLSKLHWDPAMPSVGFSASDELVVSVDAAEVVLTIDAPVSVHSLTKTGAKDLVLAGGGSLMGELAVAEGTLKIDAGNKVLDLVCDLQVAEDARMEIVSTSGTAPTEGRLVRLHGETSGLGELYFGINYSTNEICNANFNVMKAWTDKKNAIFRVNSGATLGNVAGSTLVVRAPVTFADSQTVVRSIVPYTDTPSAIDQFPLGVSSDPSGEYVFRNCAVTNALWFSNGRLVFDNCKARLLGVYADICLSLGSTLADDRYKEYGADYFGYVPSGSVTSSMDILEGSYVLMEQVLFSGNGNDTTVTTINMSGGNLRCIGSNIDGGANSIKLAHWPKATSYFNMTGGDVYLKNRFCLCISGTGYFNMSGGTLEAEGFCLNGRTSQVGGMGHMDFTGGTIKLRNASALHADWCGGGTKEQAYKARLGGSGSPTLYGLFEVKATAELVGETRVEAVNFEVPLDSSQVARISRDLTGAGGFNKTGEGTLVVDSQLSCSGAVRVLKGQLTLKKDYAMTNALVEVGAGCYLSFKDTTQKFGGVTATKGDWAVPADMMFVDAPRYLVEPVETDAGMTVRSVTFPGSVDVSSWTVCGMSSITNLELGASYVIARCASGSVTGTPRKLAIPRPWHVSVSGGELRLESSRGFLIFCR